MNIFINVMMHVTILLFNPGVQADTQTHIKDIFLEVDEGVVSAGRMRPSGVEPYLKELVLLDIQSLRESDSSTTVFRFHLGNAKRTFYAKKLETFIGFDGSFNFNGALLGQEGSIVIASVGKVAYGRIETEEETWRMEPTDDIDASWIYRLDPSLQAPTCADPLQIEEVIGNKLSSDKLAIETESIGGQNIQHRTIQYSHINYTAREADNSTSVMPTLDLLIVYTKGLERAYRGNRLSALIAFLVGIANDCLINSEVDLRVRVVGTLKVNYPDDNYMGTALNNLSGKANKAFRNVKKMREALGADQVTLLRAFGKTNTACGIAWQWVNFRTDIWVNKYSFSVVQVGELPSGVYCADQTLVHELGHNWGLHHNEVDSFQARFPYGVGSRYIPGVAMSVMSYPWNNERTRSFFSNPDVKDSGFPTGTWMMNSARAISNVIDLIVAWKPSMIELDTIFPTNRTKSEFINSGAKSTSTLKVKCAISCLDNIAPTAYHISESPDTPAYGDTAWVPILTGKKKFKKRVVYVFDPGNGERMLYVRFRDSIGNISSAKSDSIIVQ